MVWLHHRQFHTPGALLDQNLDLKVLCRWPRFMTGLAVPAVSAPNCLPRFLSALPRILEEARQVEEMAR